MNLSDLKHSPNLYAFNDKFDLLLNLHKSKKFPKTLMLSGKKGIGKFTLVKHFLTYVFDKKYNYKLKEIDQQSEFFKQLQKSIFPNIIYLDGFALKNTKIEDIRQLKSTILKSNISKINRFIVLDDVELFNANSLNALLKIIEEPTSSNFFILINNNSRPLIETVKSRCLEFKISLNNHDRIKIIEALIVKNNLNPIIDYKTLNITPGNFCVFNNICETNDININNDFLLNLEVILNLYKKDKNMNLINLILYLAEIYFHKLSLDKSINLEKICESKDFVIGNLNKFILFNLNPNSLINLITNKINNE